MKGSRIKLLREEKGLKQEELAKMLSIAPSTIGMYERDAREPNDEIKLKMCELFDCSMDYLTGNSDYKNADEFFNSRIKETEQFVEFDLPQEYPEYIIDNFIEKIEKEPKKIFEKELKSFLINYPENLRNKIENYIRFMYEYTKNLGIQEKIDFYKEKQLFHYAYHKEMEGLTDEEIADALRFYKEMKKRVGGNNGNK